MGERSSHFKEHFVNMTWAKRRSELLKKATGGQMRLDIVFDDEVN